MTANSDMHKDSTTSGDKQAQQDHAGAPRCWSTTDIQPQVGAGDAASDW